MKRLWKSGDPFIWLTGSALGFCLLMVIGLVGIILYNGLGVFWPRDLAEFQLRDGTRIMGQVVGRQEIKIGEVAGRYRQQLKVGSRDVYGLDFCWIPEAEIKAVETPLEAVVFERLEWGDFYGFITGLYEGDEKKAAGDDTGWEVLNQYLERARELRQRLHRLEKEEIGQINFEIEQLRLKQRRLEMEGVPAGARTQHKAKSKRLWLQYEALAEELAVLRREGEKFSVGVVLASGEENRILVADIVRAYRPNRLGLGEKTGIYLSKTWEFIAGEPRESNTEGGIFPALFGTVMMVMLMSLAVVPFGVLAALYLREYASQGMLVRAIRIAVNNLAGVPSIVFGMFGLGFFVYGVGGAIDRLFFQEALPAPTFGTGGILWASLTLALLTVPVVVVATEEALSAVPREMREGSLALGSTKFQMIWNVVLPGALPGVLTGVILATARGAGEVAPLMITGVVKLAPDLPLDGYWPFFHLERKFMHLGFHIYDMGFQSPNVEAARPMVYTTALLLLVIVLVLNLAAIVVRNRLRKRYSSSGV